MKQQMSAKFFRYVHNSRHSFKIVTITKTLADICCFIYGFWLLVTGWCNEKNISHSIIYDVSNHVGARHCRKPLSRYCRIYQISGFCTNLINIASTVGMTKSRAFVYKSCQNISSTVRMTKSWAFVYKSCQNISLL